MPFDHCGSMKSFIKEVKLVNLEYKTFEN